MRDPFAGYDQWKTASPYDDMPEMPVVDNAVPGFALLCPCCGETLEWEEEVFEHDGPAAIGIGPEGGFRGWRCGNCSWEQECDDLDTTLTESLKKKIRALQTRLNKAINRKPSPPVTLADLESNFPEGDFRWEDCEAGDWVPWWCDDCDTWHQTAYATNYKRTNGVLDIEHMSVDQDGNWDCTSAWNSAEDGSFEESDVAYAMANDSNDYFRAWAEYYLWAVKNMRDPLESCLKNMDTMTGEQWINWCIDAAADSIKYLEM
jgi:hypothetical protein